MDVPRSIFREYDVRGVVDRELTPEFAGALGRAYASLGWARLNRSPVIAVGRDNRPSGESLSDGLRQGLAEAGSTVVDVGMLPTPALYFAVSELGLDGGMQVTGSHNPPEFNGFKMVLGGDALFGTEIQALREIITAESWRVGQGRHLSNASVLVRYRDAIIERNTLSRPVRVVVDCGNGVGSLIAVETLRGLGAEVTPLFCESDGSFPNHHPDPTVLENLKDLQEAVRRGKAECGIAFDGDADRIGAVDETGKVVFGDQLLVLFGRDAVRRFGKGSQVIFDVKCSDVLPQALEAAGAKPVMWKTGHSLIKAKMKELNAPLAGEMSGHMFFAGDYYGFDDALFAAARLLSYVARHGGPLSSLLADLPNTFATPEIRVACPEERKFSIVEEAASHFADRYEVLTIDGVRISFAAGWGLLRASNTQPVLVMRFEATSETELAEYRNEVESWLHDRGIDT
ncbi:MAG: phosphomannomutase/phosphoglucomutase [Gemmatimonadales bacterium]|nr:phosphomannomutase/phosphoglucomutase [Gemmatimonadales bacterium]